MSWQAAADLWHDTQDVGEELDPSLEPVLAKAFVKRGNATLIKLGDKEIDFKPDFRLYITTKLGKHTVCIVPFTGCNIPLPQWAPSQAWYAFKTWRTSLQVSLWSVAGCAVRGLCIKAALQTGMRHNAAICKWCCLYGAGNPHYTPEVSTKVMIVNFAVKQQGLEAQLLSTVVKQERADLDRQKNELVVKVAQGKRTQVGCRVDIYLPVFMCASQHTARSLGGHSVEEHVHNVLHYWQGRLHGL